MRYATAKSCQYSGRHHSDDLIEVFHGRENPAVLCGFHAQAPIDFTKVSTS